jgi:site-specific DNA recombinase
MTAAIYARVSTDRQERDETVKSQLEACEAYADSLTLSVDRRFVDDGVTGTTLLRPALTQLRDAIRDKNVTTLVVYDTDRLSRNLSHLLILMEEFGKAGTQVLFVKCPLEDTPEGRVLFNIKGVFAEYEREKIRERTLRGKVRYIKDGGWFGLPPFGYRLVAKHLEIDPTESRWLADIFAKYANGEATLNGLADYLTANNVPTRRKSKRGRWDAAVVSRMLAKELYTGRFRREIKGVPGSECEVSVPPIIDRSIWERAQLRFQQNKAEAEHNKVHLYLLTGLVRCGICGRRYYGRHSKVSGHRHYRCETNQNPARHQTTPCRNQSVRADILEDAVWVEVVQLVTQPEKILIGQQRLAEEESANGASDLEEQLFTVRRTVTKLEARKSRLLDLILERPQDKLVLSRKLDELDAQMDHLRAREQTAIQGLGEVSTRQERLADVREAFRGLRTRLDQVTPVDRRRICQLLIAEIRIFNHGEAVVSWLLPAGPANPEFSGVGDSPAVLQPTNSGNSPAVLHNSPKSQQRR